MTKKRFQVVKRKANDVNSIRGMKFGRSNAFTVADEGLAREIERDFGMKGTGDVHVMPDEMTDRRLSGEYGTHHYVHSVPAKTWLSKDPDENWVKERNRWVRKVGHNG